VELECFHGGDHQFPPNPSSTKVRHNGHRDDMSFSHHPESSEIGEAELESTHDVSNNLVVALCDNECFGTALVDFHEEIRTIVFRKTDPVYLHDR
jgi:hypothetical protein